MPSPYLVGMNMLRQPWSGNVATLAMQTGRVVMGDFIANPAGGVESKVGATSVQAIFLTIADGEPREYKGDPYSGLFLPIFDSFQPSRKAVASLVAQISWSRYFDKILPPTDDGIVFVLISCSTSYTFIIHGTVVEFLGTGDSHDPAFESMRKSTNFQNITSIADSTKVGLQFDKQHCPIEINVYPTKVGHTYTVQIFVYHQCLTYSTNATDILRRSRFEHAHYCYVSDDNYHGVCCSDVSCV
jgi:hypothetical protein